MNSKLSRRDFLKLSASGTASAVLLNYVAVPQAAAEKNAQFEGIKIVVMYQDNEFPEEYVQEIADQTGLEIEYLDDDAAQWDAMWAEGRPPDIWRSTAQQTGPRVVRRHFKSLNAFVDASSVIKWDDMFPSAYKPHMYNAEFQVGQEGDLYAMTKDWGVEFLLYLYTTAFEEAGLEVPTEGTVWSYADWAEIMPKLAKTEGDRTLRYGGDGQYWEGKVNHAFILDLLPQIEDAEPLYTEDYSQINLANNAAVYSIFDYWFQLAKAKIVPSVLNPAPTWYGTGFPLGIHGVVQSGYWYGQMASDNETAGKVMILPAPYWNTPERRRDSVVYATASVIAAETRQPDAAWRVVEYFSGERPAEERAASGWGVPLLRSMFDLLPQETEYDQLRYRVLEAELPLSEEALNYNPFVNGFVDAGPAIDAALMGDLTLQEALEAIETATNEQLTELRARYLK